MRGPFDDPVIHLCAAANAASQALLAICDSSVLQEKQLKCHILVNFFRPSSSSSLKLLPSTRQGLQKGYKANALPQG